MFAINLKTNKIYKNTEKHHKNCLIHINNKMNVFVLISLKRCAFKSDKRDRVGV